MKRQIILASATGYSWAAIEPFVNSLRTSGYAGDLLMLVDDARGSTAARLRREGIFVLPVTARIRRTSTNAARLLFNRRWRSVYAAAWRFCDALPVAVATRRDLKIALGHRLHHIACSRYFHYYQWLRRHGGGYAEAMLTDVRDVIFQRDPFSYPLRSPLRFSLEHPSVTIGGQINNAQWIGHSYGPEALARVAHHRVSCSGTTYGTIDGLLDYTAAMTDDLLSLTHAIRGADGFDQGVHNYLLWTGRFPDAEICENGAGPVLTMQAVPPAELRTDANGRILDAEGRVAPVLHQYDRHPVHRDRLVRLLASPSA